MTFREHQLRKSLSDKYQVENNPLEINKIQFAKKLLGPCDHRYPGGSSAVTFTFEYDYCNICDEELGQRDNF